MAMTWDSLEHIQGKPEWRMPIPPTCRKCSYNLTGLTEQRCPECGQPFTWQEVRRRAARVWSLANRLRYANQDAKLGLKMVLIGLVALALSRLLDLWLGTLWLTFLTSFISLGMAVLGMVLGAQVFNIRRIPVWARQHLQGSPPSMLLGFLVVILGLILFASAILL